MATYSGKSYRLRAGSPMPKSDSGTFVIHSFMAEKQEQSITTCESTVLASSDFRGQGGEFSSANYTRIPVKGVSIYKASESNNSKYVEEFGGDT